MIHADAPLRPNFAQLYNLVEEQNFPQYFWSSEWSHPSLVINIGPLIKWKENRLIKLLEINYV